MRKNGKGVGGMAETGAQLPVSTKLMCIPKKVEGKKLKLKKIIKMRIIKNRKCKN